MSGRGPASGFSVKGISTHINGRHAFVAERVLELIARETEVIGQLQVSKSELAYRFGCSEQMLSRSLTRLKKDGLITIELAYAPSGAQMANVYRATEIGIDQALRVRRQAERERRERLKAKLAEAEET